MNMKEMHEHINEVINSIPEPIKKRELIMCVKLFSIFKEFQNFKLPEYPNGMYGRITATFGNLIITCDPFLHFDDTNIYEFVDNKLTIVAKITGTENYI